jgi:hypothetical protein
MPEDEFCFGSKTHDTCVPQAVSYRARHGAKLWRVVRGASAFNCEQEHFMRNTPRRLPAKTKKVVAHAGKSFLGVPGNRAQMQVGHGFNDDCTSIN